MDILATLLQVVGGLVVLLAVGAVLAWYGLRLWVRYKLGDAAKMAGHGGYGHPPRIHLHRFEGDWHHPEDIARLKKHAEELGYIPIERYGVDEMHDVFLWALFNPGDATAAVIYDHPFASVWFDVFTHYPDGSGATVSNGKSPTVTQVPGDLMHKDPQLTLRAARDMLLEIRKPGPFTVMDPDNFAAEFEATYAKQMDHLISKPDLSDQYMRETGRAFGITHQYTDDEYAKGKALTLEQLRQRAAEACLDNFLKTAKLTPAQWESWRERTFVIHERLSSDEVVERFCAFHSTIAADDPRIVAARARQTEPLPLFAALNQLLSVKTAYQQLGEVDAPVKGHVYLAPR